MQLGSVLRGSPGHHHRSGPGHSTANEGAAGLCEGVGAVESMDVALFVEGLCGRCLQHRQPIQKMKPEEQKKGHKPVWPHLNPF